MNEKVKKELDNIVNTLTSTGNVSEIYLFGSYARGEETPDSDLDICVLTEEKKKTPYQVAVEFRKKLLGKKTMPLDLLAFNRDDFYRYADCPVSFQNEIKNGVLLYGRS